MLMKVTSAMLRVTLSGPCSCMSFNFLMIMFAAEHWRVGYLVGCFVCVHCVLAYVWSIMCCFCILWVQRLLLDAFNAMCTCDASCRQSYYIIPWWTKRAILHISSLNSCVLSRNGVISFTCDWFTLIDVEFGKSVGKSKKLFLCMIAAWDYRIFLHDFSQQVFEKSPICKLGENLLHLNWFHDSIQMRTIINVTLAMR